MTLLGVKKQHRPAIIAAGKRIQVRDHTTGGDSENCSIIERAPGRGNPVKIAEAVLHESGSRESSVGPIEGEQHGEGAIGGDLKDDSVPIISAFPSRAIKIAIAA